MDETSNILKILLKRMPIQEFLNGQTDCMRINENQFVKIMHRYMTFYSETEVRNMLNAVGEFLQEYYYFHGRTEKGTACHFSVFDVIFYFVDKILVLQNNEIMIRYERILRWRRTTQDIGEETFVTAFQAHSDLKNGKYCRDFTWPVVIGHNNVQLRKITEQGMAENHFHLWGSAPYFHLSWIWIMNNVIELDYHSGLDQIDEKPRSVYLTAGEQQTGNIRQYCFQAALIRVYLYSKLMKTPIKIGKYYCNKKDNLSEEYVGCNLEDIQKCISTEEFEYLWKKKTYQRVMQYLNNYEQLRWHIEDIQNAIGSVRRISYHNKEDYALNAVSYSGYHGDDTNYVLSGERWLLYEMFRRSEKKDKSLGVQIYNLFYIYLLLKEKIRGELIQSNDWVGFENFAEYQGRTGYFAREERLEDLKAKMAVSSCFRQKVVSLELRITPRDTAYDNHCEIFELEQIINSKEERDLRDKYYYVMHFIKQPDQEELYFNFCDFRHAKLRREIKKKALALLSFRRIYPMEAKRVLGIDAASTEIGCRPEVFAQCFRTLRNDTYISYTPYGEQKLPQLKTTYHVGEDFLDIIDGLRAIDEAIVFLNLDCGDRLGHALALGISVEEWYRVKNYHISLPKQDYLDNIVWFYHAIIRYNINGLENLKQHFESEFRKYFEDVYAMYMDVKYLKEIQKARGKQGHKGTMNFDIHAYHDAWKLRGDAPELYRQGYYFDDGHHIAEYEKNAVNYKFPPNFDIRFRNEAAMIYHFYHYNSQVRQSGNAIIDLKVNLEYVRGVAKIQAAMQKEIGRRGIGIETNPSSNYMIGSFDKYSKHPIIKWYNEGLTFDMESLQMSPQLWVSINTDDQGIFNIKLENEYAFIARALEKETDENGKPIYTKTMIYEWLDKIRIMGLRQSFLNNDMF